jgi:hypothetical protein
LRLWGIEGLGDLDFDEQASFFIGSMPPREMLVYLLAAPFEHPPLFYLLFHGWLAAVGGSETAMRVFAVLPGTLAVPVVGSAVGRIAGPRTGIAAAIVLALAPLHVYYSRDARMYSLLSLWMALAVYAVALGCRALSPTPPPNLGKGQGVGASAARRRWAGILLAGAGAAALATHYYAAAPLVALAAAFGLVGSRPHPNPPEAVEAAGVSPLPLGEAGRSPRERARTGEGVTRGGRTNLAYPFGVRWLATALAWALSRPTESGSKLPHSKAFTSAPGQESGRRLWGWALAAVAATGALVWFASASGFRTSLTAVYPRPVAPERILEALVQALGAPFSGPTSTPEGSLAAALLVVAPIAWLGVRGIPAGGGTVFRVSLWGFAAAALAIPLLLVVGRAFAPRFCVLAVPFLAALVGLAATRTPRGRAH